MRLKITKPSWITLLFVSSLWLFCISDYFGQVWPRWEANDLCFRYLGCNAGFFGYDALVHFFFGITAAFGLMGIFESWPKLSLFHKTLRHPLRNWKNVLIVILFVAAISYFWEILECSTDAYRMYFLHLDLLHPKNILAQPSDFDTMGDMTCAVVGSFIALIMARLFPISHKDA